MVSPDGRDVAVTGDDDDFQRGVAVRKELDPLIYGYAEYVFEVSFKM